jgi:hypothetical protein
MSDISTVTEHLIVACQRRWRGLSAVQEAAMLCQKNLCRILLLALLGLSLGGCAPYYDEGGSYYSSEVYTSPAPTYYTGRSSYYSNGYYTPPPRYYVPPARYYQPTPRYYSQPRMYQPSRQYQSPPRYYQPSQGDYRMHQHHDWDGHNRGNWNNDYRGQDGRNHRSERGGHNWRDNHR